MSENICPNTTDILSNDVTQVKRAFQSPAKKPQRRATTGQLSGLSSKDAALLALAKRGNSSPLNSPMSKKLFDIIQESSPENCATELLEARIDIDSYAPQSPRKRRHTIQTSPPSGK